MTFLALLTKELRLRMRRERTIWIIIAYILFMGLLGWTAINSYSGISNYNGNALSSVGLILYYLLSQLQLFLIIFITPAFTATAINGEKERQTFDLLLCSRLSPFSLLSGKLLAGLTNAFLLIAASAPLFSLVFFFGGVGPGEVVKAIIVYITTTIVVGTFGLFCSSVFQRPAISTAISYMVCLVWIGLPIMLSILGTSSVLGGKVIYMSAGNGMVSYSTPSAVSTHLPLLFAINPITALTNTYPNGGMAYMGFYNPFLSLTSAFYPNGVNRGVGLAQYAFTLFGLHLTAWKAYTMLNLLIAVIFFLLSILATQSGIVERIRTLFKREQKKVSSNKATVSA